MRRKIFFIVLTILAVTSLYFIAFPDGERVFAGAGALSTIKITKTTLNGPTTLEEGVSNGSFYGVSTAGIGDLNNDGVEDVAVGAYRHDNAANYPGAVFIHFMNTDGSIDSTVLLEHDTANGATLTPSTTNDYGVSVEGLGDLNGDGVEDIAVGAPIKSLGGGAFGSVFIHFMNADGTIDSTSEINNSTLNGPTYLGNFRYGDSIANIGDLNSDGVTDIAVGMPNADSSQGLVFIHFMNTDGSIDSTIEMNESNVPGLTLANNDRYGSGITDMEDMNSDGVPDIAVSAIGVNSNAGAVYIHFMNADGSVDSITEIDGSTTNGPVLNGTFYGKSVTQIGDLDLDGVNDLAVSAHNDSSAGSGFGAFHVHFMNSDGSIKRTSKISSLRNNVPDTSGSYSYGLDNVGDINDDGVDDILAGAYFDDDEGARTGAAYLHFMELTPDITVTQSGGSTAVSEDGLTDTIQITLESLQPTSNVTITLTPNSQLTLDKATLVFTPLNWDTPQSFTVSAVDDILVEGDHSGIISYSISSLDSKYNDYELLSDTTVLIEDNDPGLLVVFQNGTVQELLTTDTMSVSLLTPPTDDVTVNLDPDNQLYLSESVLTFTSANWDTPQDVIVYGIDDGVVEGSHTGTVSFDLTSNDSNYQGVTDSEDIEVTDGPGDGIIFTPYYESTDVLTEGSTQDLGDLVITYDPSVIDPINTPSLVITATPNAELDLGSGAGVAVDFIFDPFGSWFDPQVISGTIVDDGDVEGEHQASITFTISLVYYGVITPNPYTFLIQDNDPGVVVSESSSSTLVTEGGATDTVSVVMSTQPTNDVVVTLTSDSQISLDSNILTFTSLNWDTPQIVTVTAVNDTEIEGPHTGLLEFSVSSLDVDYDGFTINDITVSITDNDSAPTPDSGGSSSSSGFILPHIRLRDKIKETDSRFVDLEAYAPYTITYFEISNTPDFAVKETYQREYTKKDLYWDLCKGLSACDSGEKFIYARFYSDIVGVRETFVSVNYNPKIECPYFKGFLRKGSKTNDPLEVKKAQEFLNRELSISLDVDGIFGKHTDRAVRDFQDKYPQQILFPWSGLKKSTGWWYITTSAYANFLIGCR